MGSRPECGTSFGYTTSSSESELSTEKRGGDPASFQMAQMKERVDRLEQRVSRMEQFIAGLGA